ncbi:MAG: lamin tail domain-containing protein [Deltaproteobacteria bacterium]|nr:lamin tail domain-containing protein [Deltaproteobacteria bacterium]
MRLSWLSLIPVLFAVTCGGPKTAQPICTPGTEIFCRCRGGTPGTKLCNDEGNGFGECRLADGECTEIPEVTTTEEASTGVGVTTTTGVGGAPPACAHDLCEQGDPLEPSCDPCVNELCGTVDPYCCNLLAGQSGSWDAMCIAEVQKVCGLDCGVTPSATASTGTSTSSTATSTSSGGPQCFGVEVLIPGDLVITEIMNDSSSLSDNQGEWFELYNTQSECIDLKGVVFESQNDSKPHVVASSVIVKPKSRVLICRDKAALAALGVSCDYSVGSSITLGNSSDTLNVKAGTLVIDGVVYSSTFIQPVGASRSLDPTATDHKSNDNELNWCVAKSFITGSSGDRGTPGEPNDFCD